MPAKKWVFCGTPFQRYRRFKLLESGILYTTFKTTKIQVFWGATLCSQVFWRVGVTSFLRPNGSRWEILLHLLTLKVKVIQSCELLVSIYQSTRHNIADDLGSSKRPLFGKQTFVPTSQTTHVNFNTKANQFILYTAAKSCSFHRYIKSLINL
jgi:hypothetical protein